VQAGTHVCVLASQARFVPQLPLPTHATHWPAGEQNGVRPLHCASMVHWTHLWVVVLQVWVPVQFEVARH
jgi:hypothetical protein